MTSLCSISLAIAGEGGVRVPGWGLQSIFVLDWEPAGIGGRLILCRTKFQIGGGANLSS
jgi:hypothetical protein